MQDRQGMIVGVDGTQASQAAIDWALAHTDVFGPVRPLYAWDYPIMASAGTPFGYAAIPPTQEMQDAAERAAREFVASLDGVDAEVVTVKGDPGVALCAAASDAAALIVGTRDHGAILANLLGSVGRYCADHSPVPLVIVPRQHDPHDDATPSPQPVSPHPVRTVVVGIDGSDAAYDALLWAAHSFPDAKIAAITAWQTPLDAPVLFGGDRFDLASFRSHAKALVNEAADKAAAELGWEADRIERRIAEGDPRWVLLAAHDEADLLVVGRRGRSGLKHLILGSTTTSLIHHPRGAIAVVPATTDDD